MKETTNFMIFIALVSTLCLSLPLIIARQAAFLLQDIIGDASALHGISFDGTVNLEEASILTFYDEHARESHKITKPQIYPGSFYTFFTYVREDDCKAISGWEKEEDQNRTDVTPYRRKLNKASLYVSVILADIQQLGNDLGFIKTELSYIVDQKHILLEDGIYDAEEKKLTPGQIGSENMTESGGTMQPVYHNGYYYILPPSITAMNGQNCIYRVKKMKYPESYSIDTDMEHGYYAMNTSLRIEKLTNASMDQNYLALQTSSDHMFALSEEDQKLYITKYDLNGNLKDEISIEDFHYFDTIYKNDNYLCFSYDDTIQTLSTDTMQFISVRSKQLLSDSANQEYISIYDILHKNGRIYASMNADAEYFMNKVLVIKNDKTLYVGFLGFLKLKLSLTELPADCFPVKFRR